MNMCIYCNLFYVACTVIFVIYLFHMFVQHFFILGPRFVEVKALQSLCWCLSYSTLNKSSVSMSMSR